MADTAEHVPPKCIFLKKYRGGIPGLITVPACKECNTNFNKEDEYFRDFLAFEAYKYNKKAKELWDYKTIKAINNIKAQRYKVSTLTRMLDVEVMSPGGIYLGNVGAIIFEKDRLESVIKKIAQGIYYHMTSEILSRKSRYKIEMKQFHKEIKKYRNEAIHSSFVSIRNEIFKYYIEFNEDSTKFFLWLVFFDSVDIHVSVILPSPTPPAPSDTPRYQ